MVNPDMRAASPRNERDLGGRAVHREMRPVGAIARRLPLVGEGARRGDHRQTLRRTFGRGAGPNVVEHNATGTGTESRR